MRRFVILLAAALVAALPAQELQLLTENYPPFNYEDASKPGGVAGLSVDLVREIQRRVGHQGEIELWLWTDAYQHALETPGVGLFSTTRTAEREEHFRWVGPLATNRWCLFAKAEAGIELADLAAGGAYTIGTYRDDAVDAHLRAAGLEAALKPTTDDRINARKLMEDKIDLWAGGELQVPFKARQSGYRADAIEPVLTFAETEIYLAFNRDTDPELVARWQAAYEAMVADGSYAEICQRHGLAPSP